MQNIIAVGKPYRGIGMEGLISRWYAANGRRELARHRELARRIAAEVAAGSPVLEVAPGPGYLAIEMAKLGLRVTAVDISRTFVEIARQNAAEAGVKVEVDRGNASALPYADGQFARVVCTAAFKNFSHPVEALREMRRVLTGGGEARIVDLRRDATAEEVGALVEGLGLGAVNRAITRQTFRWVLLPRAYTAAEMEKMAREAGFTSPEVRVQQAAMEARLRG